MVKLTRPATPCESEEERRFLETNPHGESVLRVFERARIEYGRIDYAIGERGLEVWEINTNPTVTSGKMDELADSRRVTERVGEALVALAEQGAGRRRIPSEALRRIRPRFRREWRN